MRFKPLLFIGIGVFILFMSSKSSYAVSIKDRIDTEWSNDVYSISNKFNVDYNIVFAIIKQESNGRVKAIRQGNQPGIGLMQITIPAARQVGYNGTLYQLYNKYVNIYYGVKYFRYLLNMFNGNYRDAIASYNAGPSNFRNGIYSKHYVSNVYSNYYKLRSGENIFK